jgi:hypothetical protein
VTLHTQHNRRRVELNKIDFTTPGPLVHFPMDKEKQQDIEDVTPQK